jgi:hypothetical protein
MPVTLSEVINNADLPPQLRNALTALMPKFIKVALSPALVAANTSAEQTFTVNGLAVGDFAAVSKPTTQAGLVIGGARVTAANTLGITFGNLTGVGITPTAAETYLVAHVPALLNPQANVVP